MLLVLKERGYIKRLKLGLKIASNLPRIIINKDTVKQKWYLGLGRPVFFLFLFLDGNNGVILFHKTSGT